MKTAEGAPIGSTCLVPRGLFTEAGVRIIHLSLLLRQALG